MQKRMLFRGDKRFWAPIAISSGLTITFFGIGFVAENMCVGWVDIAFGLGLLLVGLSIAPMRQ